MSPTLKALFIALLVFVMIGVGFTAYYYYLNPRPASEQTNNNNTSGDDGIVSRKEVPTTQAPEKFPADVPIEAGARITQNFNANATDGRFQATRAFQTEKTLAENFTLYRNYMTQAGWEVRSSLDQDNYKMLFGVKGGNNLQISMDYNAELDIRTVTISYTEVAK